MAELLTHTRRQTFRDCAYKHFIRYELGIGPAEERDFRRFGKAIHYCLDHMAHGRHFDDIASAIRLSYAEQSWGDEHARGVEAEMVVALAYGYQWRWQTDPLEYVASETGFRAPMVNPDTRRTSRTFEDAGLID